MFVCWKHFRQDRDNCFSNIFPLGSLSLYVYLANSFNGILNFKTLSIPESIKNSLEINLSSLSAPSPEMLSESPECNTQRRQRLLALEARRVFNWILPKRLLLAMLLLRYSGSREVCCCFIIHSKPCLVAYCINILFNFIGIVRKHSRQIFQGAEISIASKV